MCLSSHASCNQLASSATVPLISITSPVINELAFTQTVTSCPLMYQVPCTEPVCVTLVKIFAIIRLRRMSFISLSHPVVKAFTLRFTNAVVTHNQPHTGKCPVNFPHTEKITQQVSTLPQHHHSFPGSSQTRNPNAHVPCLNCSKILLVKLNCSRCSLTQTAEHMLSFTKMSLI